MDGERLSALTTVVAIHIWPWQWSRAGKNEETHVIFPNCWEKNLNGESYHHLFYTIISLESLSTSTSLFRLPKKYSSVHVEGLRYKGVNVIILHNSHYSEKSRPTAKAAIKIRTAWKDGYIWWLKQLHPAHTTTGISNAGETGFIWSAHLWKPEHLKNMTALLMSSWAAELDSHFSMNTDFFWMLLGLEA